MKHKSENEIKYLFVSLFVIVIGLTTFPYLSSPVSEYSSVTPSSFLAFTYDDIIQFAYGATLPETPTGVSLTHDFSGTFFINWTNPSSTFDQINVYRNGSLYDSSPALKVLNSTDNATVSIQSIDPQQCTGSCDFAYGLEWRPVNTVQFDHFNSTILLSSSPANTDASVWAGVWRTSDAKQIYYSKTFRQETGSGSGNFTSGQMNPFYFDPPVVLTGGEEYVIGIFGQVSGSDCCGSTLNSYDTEDPDTFDVIEGVGVWWTETLNFGDQSNETCSGNSCAMPTVPIPTDGDSSNFDSSKNKGGDPYISISPTELGQPQVFVDTQPDILPETTYFYEITSQNATGESPKSPKVFGRIDKPVVPDQDFFNVTAISVPDGSFDNDLKISWNATGIINASTFSVKRLDVDDEVTPVEFIPLLNRPTATTSTVTDTQPCQFTNCGFGTAGNEQGAYKYTVTAKNYAGETVFAQYTRNGIDYKDENATAINGADVVTAVTPSGFNATASGNDVNLTWDSVNLLTTNSPAEILVIRNDTVINVINFDQTSYVDKDVADGNYEYKIRMQNQVGGSNSSAVVETVDVSPDAVTNFVVVANATDADLSWDLPVGGADIDDIFVFRNDSSIATLSNTTTVYNDSTVVSGQTYSYFIRTSNAFGTADSQTETVNAGAVTPSVINDLVATAVGKDITLTWSAPNDGGSPITGYKILRKVDNGSFITLVANTGTTATSYTDLELVIGSTYSYDVRAINAEGTALGSNIASAVPFATDPPSKVLNLQLQNIGSDVQLTWDTPDNSPTGYVIERKVGNGAFGTLVADTSSTSTNHTDSTVVVSTEYTYRVAGLNQFGTGTFSDPQTITTLMPPDVPTLSAVQNQDQIDLTWTQPQSDQPITGYKIDRRVNLGSFSVLVADTGDTSLSYTDLDITSGNTYGYRIKAISSLGTSSPSNIVDVEFGSHVVVEVREQDGSSYKGGGTVKGQNSTFTESVSLDASSNAVFNNLDAGNYNFTFFDDDNFILNKTSGFVFPSPNNTATLSIDALVFDVDCPSNGGGTDVRIKLNYTTIHDITAFPSTPVCDSTDKISWSTTWSGDSGTANSFMIADFISAKFKTNAQQFLSSAVNIPTSFDSTNVQIVSTAIPVTTASDVTINFDLFLDEAPQQGGSSSSSGTTSGSTSGTPFVPTIPSEKVIIESRLTGLSVLSRTHPFAQAGDVIEGSITVQWEGEDPLSVKRIDVGEFTDIIRFDLPPFPIEQEIEGVGEFAQSEGDVPYIITLPPFLCDEETGITQNCLNPELIEFPIMFTFEFNGIEYQAETSVLVDLRPIPLDVVQIQIIALGAVLIGSALGGNAIRKRLQKSQKRAKIRKKRYSKRFDSS